MKYKARYGVRAPNVIRGGKAIPMGNNLYWMSGRQHDNGGIDIGKDLEVENNEVMQMLPTETRVFSSLPMFNGASPAELVANGNNPDLVFNAQEQWKKVNRIKDDGTSYRPGGKHRNRKSNSSKRDKVKSKTDMYYHTILTNEQEKEFRKWYDEFSSHLSFLNDNPDDPNHYYDFRGYWLNELPTDTRENKEWELSEKWKTPGHETFSTQSVYSNSTTPGGTWITDNRGRKKFIPSMWQDAINGNNPLSEFDVPISSSVSTPGYILTNLYEDNNGNLVPMDIRNVILPELVVSPIMENGKKVGNQTRWIESMITPGYPSNKSGMFRPIFKAGGVRSIKRQKKGGGRKKAKAGDNIEDYYFDENDDRYWGDTGWHYVPSSEIKDDDPLKGKGVVDLEGNEVPEATRILVDRNGYSVGKKAVQEYYAIKEAERQAYENNMGGFVNGTFVSNVLPDVNVSDSPKELQGTLFDQAYAAPINRSTIADYTDTKQIEMNNVAFEIQQEINKRRMQEFDRQLNLGTMLVLGAGMAPIAASALGGLGATSALGDFWAAHPFAYKMGYDLGAVGILGAGFDAAANLGSRGYYNDFGDFLHKEYGVNEHLAPWLNLAYVANRGTYELLKAAGKSAGKLGYNYLGNMFNFSPEYTNTFLKHQVKPMVDNAGFLLANSTPFYKTNNRVLPSDRGEYALLSNIRDASKAYADKGKHIKVNFDENDNIKIEFYNSITGEQKEKIYNARELGLEDSYIFKKIRDRKHHSRDETFIQDDKEKLVEELKKLGVTSSELDNATIDFGGLLSLNKDYNTSALNLIKLDGENYGNKELIDEINNELNGLGHVTGSQITATNVHTTHKPADVDIITTEDNYPEVYKTLTGKEEYAPLSDPYGYNGTVDHIKVPSKKYGEIDVQIIRNGSTNGTSKGRIANEIYLKYNPKQNVSRYSVSKNLEDVPMSPQELYDIHTSNVLNYSEGDQMLSEKGKHILRDVVDLKSNNSGFIKNKYDNMISYYRGVIKDFETLEEQGINLDYNDFDINKQFLKRLNVDDEVANYLAKDPDKMKLIVESIAYERSTAQRIITLDENGSHPFRGPRTLKNIRNAITTNRSYSNIGGNWLRADNGGVPFTNEDIVSVSQFPIRNGENMKNPMDLLHELERISVSPKGGYNSIIQKDYPLSEEQISAISELLRTGIRKGSTLNDIIPLLVQRTNPNLDKLSQEELENINQQVANILNLDFVHSNQSHGYDRFVGVLNKNIKGQHISSQYVDKSHIGYSYTGDNFYGFELPTLGYDVQGYERVSMLPMDNFYLRKNNGKNISSIIDNYKNKLDKALDISSKADMSARELKYKGDNLIDKVQSVVTPLLLGSTLIGGLYGLGKAMDSNLNRHLAKILDRDFDKNINEVAITFDLNEDQVAELRKIAETKGYVGIREYLDNLK